MMRPSSSALAALLVASTLTTGCYFGRTPSAKRATYVVDGTLAAVGLVIAVAPSGDSGNHDDVSGGVGQAQRDGAGFLLGSALLGASLLAIGITALVPTKHEAAPTIDVPPGRHATSVARGAQF